MKPHRLLWILLGLTLLGAMIGFFISTDRPLPFFSDSEPEPVIDPADAPEVVMFDFPEVSGVQPTIENLTYPSNAIEGELVVHFKQRNDYLNYLKLLATSDTPPLGQIDELLVVRISQSTLLKANFGQYGARASYSYQVERPQLPSETRPEEVASLQAFAQSALAISGGITDGRGEGVIVGILDSGIQAHPQFEDVYIVHIDLAGGGVAGPGASHGTSVASIISGSEGIVPDAELFVVRVLDDAGKGNSYHVAEGIVQAVDLGVQVINISLGVYQDAQLLRQAVQYAHERGVLLVAAAGNDGADRMPYPAAYPEVLSVTAVDASGQQATFANKSMDIDFAAPGVGVMTAKDTTGTVLFTGTAAAAPFVSGTLASLLSGDNALSAVEAVEILKRYLDDAGAPGQDVLYGTGLVDWNRLRERATNHVLDVALASIYIQPEVLPGSTTEIEVTVQNRGTRWFSDAELEVFIGEAEPVSFTLGALGAGQTATRKILTEIPPLDSGEVLNISARVMPEKMLQDIRLENNLKSVTFRTQR